MASIKTIRDMSLTGKRVLVRVDFNVPIHADGQVVDLTRIIATLPTIQYLIQQKAKIILVSHLGRPKGKRQSHYSLQPVAVALAEQLGSPVTFLDDCIGPHVTQAVAQMHPGSVILLENVRFYPEEEQNDSEFSASLAALAEVWVNDAFSAAHRAHASTEGIAHHLVDRVAGFLIEKELSYLGKTIHHPERPFTVILGGAKISDKINVIDALLERADTLLVGGAMAYTFMLAQGGRIGRSLKEPDKVDFAKAALKKAADRGVKLLLPLDNRAVDSLDFDKKAVGEMRIFENKIAEGQLDYIPEGWEGVDIGPQTIDAFQEAIAHSKTILWNGPMGIFEIDACNQGTFAIAEAIAHSPATSIIGGGDSVTAINQSGHREKVTFMSTGGGATLEFLEGKLLPGISVLEKIVDSTPSAPYLIAGNWKMNKNTVEAVALAEHIVLEVGQQTEVQIVICPPFTALESVAKTIESSNLHLGAQNMHYAVSGAYTGEISPEMLRHLFVTYVIIGHSERRIHFHETDALIKRKLRAALDDNLKPILCIGETQQERKSGKSLPIVRAQLEAVLNEVPQEKAKWMTIAYEPVWAIGTGQNATPEMAQEAHSMIRSYLKEQFGNAIAHQVRILYGGSMNPQNAADLLAQPDIDGGLIGGASLKVTDFVAIIECAKAQQQGMR